MTEQQSAPQRSFAEVVPPTARAVLEIDLSAIAANWLDLEEKVAPARCAAVVKSDAYGLGLERVALALRDEGCITFFVATIEEGRRLRTTCEDCDIYVLDGLMPDTAPVFRAHGLRPVLSSLPEITEWVAFCRTASSSQPAAIQIDSGMTRLGIGAADLDWLTDEPEALEPFRPALVLSHLATADTPAHGMANDQLRRFQDAIQRLPATEYSLANSGALIGTSGLEIATRRSGFIFDLARPGIALYGGRAVTGQDNPMRNVVRYHARMLQVRRVGTGTPIGYGAAYRTPRAALIATVASGYADGYPRAAVNTASGIGPRAYLGEVPVRVVGRISMDLITVDVTDAAELAQRGGWITLIDERTTLDDIADAAGTIGYEVLTGLGERAHRIYSPTATSPRPPAGA